MLPHHLFQRLVSLALIVAIIMVSGCATPPESQPNDTVYTVQKGDKTLDKVAEKITGDRRNAKIIAEFNGIKRTGKLKPGQQLKIPASLSSSSSSSSSSSTGLSTQGEGAVLLGIVGTVAGAVLCDERNRVACMAAGAAIGSGIGYAVGQALAERQKQYASTEDFYDAQIKQTTQLSRALSRNNQSLRRSIQDDQRQINTLMAKYRNGQATKGQLENFKSTLDKKYAANAETLAKAKKEYEINQALLDEAKQKGQLQNQRIVSLTRRNGELKKNIDDMQQHVDQQATTSATLSL